MSINGLCFDLGSVSGCTENCAGIIEGECELYASPEEFLEEQGGTQKGLENEGQKNCK